MLLALQKRQSAQEGEREREIGASPSSASAHTGCTCMQVPDRPSHFRASEITKVTVTTGELADAALATVVREKR